MNIDELLKKGNAIGQEVSKQTGVPFASYIPTSVPTPNTSNPINAADIPGVKPLIVSPAPISTTSAGISGIADAVKEQARTQAELQAKETTAKSEKDSSKSLLEDLKDSIVGVQTSRTNLEEQAGIDKKAQAVTDATNKIEASQRAQTNELKALNEQGLTDVQKSASAREINRQYAFEQADLALIQSAANRDYETAQSIVDRKIQLQLEPLKTQLDFAQRFYDENQDELSKAEQNALINRISIQKQDYETAQQTLKDVSSIQLEAAKNGAPASVIQAIGKAQDVGGAIEAAGEYGQDLLRTYQIRKAKADAIKAENGGGLGTDLSPTAQAVIENPNLLNSLTPTVKGQVITQLQQAGYDTTRLGAKPLSDTAIASINQSNTALTSLEELKTLIENNQDKLGPIIGFAALNPYSEARKVQADIDRVKQQVGKALEGGVLRKEDEDKYKKILATITDQPSTALYKLGQLTNSIQKSVDDYTTLQTGAGKSSNITSSLQKKGNTTAGTTTGGNKYTVTKE